jgi:hypothetical protein
MSRTKTIISGASGWLGKVLISELISGGHSPYDLKLISSHSKTIDTNNFKLKSETFETASNLIDADIYFDFAFQKLQEIERVKTEIETIKSERNWLRKELLGLQQINEVYPSDSNFILVKVEDANKLYNYLINKGLVVRNRSNQPLCLNTLRLTVGTSSENRELIEKISEFSV